MVHFPSISFITPHVFLASPLNSCSFSDWNFFLDLFLIVSNRFLKVLYVASFFWVHLFKKFLFLFWWFYNAFSNPMTLIALEFNFKFVNNFFTVRPFVGRFYDWFLGCFIGFKCEDNRKMTWQFSFYYDWRKVIVAYYTIGDNVVYGICWVSCYRCWFICQRNHIANHEI